MTTGTSSGLHLTIGDRIGLAMTALHFFSVSDWDSKCATVGVTRVPGHMTPFHVQQLLTFLTKTGVPNVHTHAHYIATMCDALRRAGLLLYSGPRGGALFGESYMTAEGGTPLQRGGRLWLGRALGPELLHAELANYVTMITGVTPDGDPGVGSGLVVADDLILTCAHVLNDMTVDEEQSVGGIPYRVVECLPHPKVDVGLIRVAGGLKPPRGLAYRDPVIGEPVINLGFPRITYTKSSALLMQRGEVIGTGVRLLFDEEVFLYSAIARPGNSGGPIVAETGHVVGIVSQDLVDKPVEGKVATMPFFAGVPSTVIYAAILELDPKIPFPLDVTA